MMLIMIYSIRERNKKTMANNCLFLIVGASGSGKTTIANTLEERYGYKQIQSYTTRPKRYETECGHTFVTDEEFNNLTNLIGFTHYNNFRYCATAEQADNATLYVIDPAGVEFLKKNYSNKPVKVITITSPIHTRINRMEQRGDNFSNIMDRIVNDIDFRNFLGDFNIDNNDDTKLNDIVEKIHEYIVECEKEAEDNT